MTTSTRTRRLDPDALAALEEERDFLLRSLEDLDREHAVGDVDEHDYVTLKDDYTARAARTIRAIDAHQATAAATQAPRSRTRILLTTLGVVAFAVLAGVLVAEAAGRRDASDTATGSIRETVRMQLDQAVTAASEQRYDDALAIYDEVLDKQPDNVEALTYRGWTQFLSGDQGNGVVALIEATEAAPDYPDAHAFLAVSFYQLGRPETALRELDRLDQLDAPRAVTAMTDPLRTQIEAALAQSEGGGK